MTQDIDFETICDDVLSIMTANLNQKITDINTEKGDSITLKAVPTGAYIFGSLNGKTANYDPFVFYGIQAINEIEDDVQVYAASSIEIAVVVLLADMGDDIEIDRRLLRYGRALKEVFEDHFELSQSGGKIRVSSKPPVEVQLKNSSNFHRACGVTLGIELG